VIETLVQQAPHLWLAYAFAVGAVVGSFLNVVIARVPAGESVVHPRSRCPRCQNPIAWFDNIPVISWVLLRARCRSCGLPISIRYPIVEALLGVLAIAIATQFGPTLAALGYFLCAAMLVSLAYIDLDTWLLPSEITLPLIGLGLLSPLWNPTLALPMQGIFPAMRSLPLAFLSSVSGALAGGLFLAAIAFIGEKLGREWMGWGDVWLFAGIGAWLGLPALLPVMMLASVQGAIVGIVLLAAGKALGARESGAIAQQARETEKVVDSQLLAQQSLASKASAGVSAGADGLAGADDEDDWVPPPTAVPFGPFLVLGALEQLLVGERLWAAWMSLIARLVS
jgi:leader peptidase (prepilin peptidase)/N-methyltransferase